MPRPVLDCRHINPELQRYKCCFEDQSVLDNCLKREIFYSRMISGGISPYHDIFRTHNLPGFWMEGARSQKMYIVFNVLPFGISTAGYMFTKVLRVVLKWRYMGFKVVLCLDDGRGGEHGFERALCSSLYIQKYLLTFGFSTAYAKCRWMPSLISIWLG